MKEKIVFYLHGKGGTPAESAHYEPLFPGAKVIGIPYSAQTPWEAKEELPRLFDALCGEYGQPILIANSIGAYFAMHSLAEKRIEQAFFLSPIVDMEKLILQFMAWANATEEELQLKKRIETPFGETLDWEYLSYVRQNPICWEIPTHILYAEKDNLTSLETVRSFAQDHGATLTVAAGAEHWFHTEEQMKTVDRWIRKYQSCEGKMDEIWKKLYEAANGVRRERKISETVTAGEVGAAILSASGKIYTGVCVDTACTLGICAERNAIFNMITSGESKIEKVLAVMPDGKTGAPCGACRELMAQLMPDSYKDIEIMLDYETGRVITLGELTPEWWI